MLILTEEQITQEKDPSVLTEPMPRAERISTCNSCEEKCQYMGVDICKKCDCIIAFKTLIKLAPCPLNKWVIPIADLPKAE